MKVIALRSTGVEEGACADVFFLIVENDPLDCGVGVCSSGSGGRRKEAEFVGLVFCLVFFGFGLRLGG